jgi:hypothetical protein
MDILAKIIHVLPVIDLDTPFRVGVSSASPFPEGRVVEAVCLHSVELVIDITDKTRRVLDKKETLDAAFQRGRH